MLSWLHVEIVNPSRNLVWLSDSDMNSKTGGAPARALNVQILRKDKADDSYLYVIYFFFEIVWYFKHNVPKNSFAFCQSICFALRLGHCAFNIVQRCKLLYFHSFKTTKPSSSRKLFCLHYDGVQNLQVSLQLFWFSSSFSNYLGARVP